MAHAEKQYHRFSVAQRIEHLVLILSFSTLGLTGLIQKYAQSGISQALIQFLGGIESTRIIHRVAAVIFVLGAVYHFIVVGYKLFVERRKATMLPGIKDVKDGIGMIGYNVGLRKDRPRMGRYNFTEKVEYWAMMWGLVLMGLTGFMLWNPIATTNILPGQFIPAAKVAHGMEAVLAVLAILIWHFYNVHIKKWNWSMIKGKLSHEEMEEEHAGELEEIERGEAGMIAPIEDIRKRRKIFIPLAVVFALVCLFAIYQFVTYEETALTTIAPSASEDAPVFSVPTAVPEALPSSESNGNVQPGFHDGDIGKVNPGICRDDLSLQIIVPLGELMTRV